MPLDVHLPRRARDQQPQETGRPTITRTIRARDIEAALATSQHAMALFDEDGRLVRTNRKFDELLALDGHPEFQALDLRARARLLEPRDARGRRIPASRVPVARALRGDALVGVVGVDLRVRALNGAEHALHVTATPLSTRAGRITGCVVVAHDLDATRRVAAQLHEVAAQMTALSMEVTARAQERDGVLAAMSDGVLLYDAAGNLRQANPAARALLDVAPEAPPDEALAQVEERLATMPRADLEGRLLPREAWPLERVLRGEQVAGTGRATADATRQVPDGREQVLSISAAPIYQGEQLVGAVVLLRDETEERRREREAAEHASQIEGLFEAMTDGLAFYDAKGRALRMNAAARRLLGYAATEERAAAALPVWSEHPAFRNQSGQLVVPETWPLTRILRGEMISAERAADVRIRAPDDTEGVLAVSGAPVYDNGGHIIGAVLSLRDVTETRRLEAERTQMMHLVSHELKTPLSAISMSAEVIERLAAQGKLASRETINVLTEGITKMKRLVDDLGDASKMEIGQLTLKLVPTDLRTLCRTEAGELTHATQRMITLRLPTRPMVANIDPIRIDQVLGNLLSNALKYSPPGSDVLLRLLRRHGVARIEVHDEGPGIPSEAKPHLFERFFRVPSMQEQEGMSGGLGLGLYIARTLTKRHGGEIGVESEPGHGSTFWFTLPLLASASG